MADNSGLGDRLGPQVLVDWWQVGGWLHLHDVWLSQPHILTIRVNSPDATGWVAVRARQGPIRHSGAGSRVISLNDFCLKILSRLEITGLTAPGVGGILSLLLGLVQ